MGRNSVRSSVRTYDSQAVERAIKLVTEAAGTVIGPEARDGYIRQKIKSRREISKFYSKKHFFPKLEKQ